MRRSASSGGVRVSVSVRVRPPTRAGGGAVVDVGRDGSIAIGEHDFRYPASVIVGSDQSACFSSLASSLLDRLQEGYSVTLLAYGQTGSGKTHTMFGPPGSLSETALEQCMASGGGGGSGAASGGAGFGGAGVCPEDWGVFPRAMMHLLRQPDVDSLQVSAVEVYQEQAFDLLAGRKPLKVGKSKSSAAVAAGGRSVKVGQVRQIARNSGSTGNVSFEEFQAKRQAAEEKKKEMERRRDEAAAGRGRGGGGRGGGGGGGGGRARRLSAAAAGSAGPAGSASSSSASSSSASSTSFATVGETHQEIKSDADVARLARLVEATRVAHGHALNARSSRSHCLVHVHVITRSGGVVARRMMLFVDLAGSERIMKTQVQGQMRSEAVKINSSLTALGRVIKQLGEAGDHVSYRDSTLTMLLKTSFGGRSCAAVVINVAADAMHAEETVSSLRFGGRMTRVTNNATRVIGQDSSQVVAAVEAQLAGVQRDLRQLEGAGAGLTFGAGAVPTEVRSYRRNAAALEDISARLVRTREALVEAKAGGGGARRGGGSSVASLEAEVEQLMFEQNNMQMILLRQQSIKGFVSLPTKGYQSKQAEAQQLESQLALLQGSGGGGGTAAGKSRRK